MVDSDKVLLLERDVDVAVLVLNRPETLNALNPPLMRALVATLQQLADDETVRCVVLTGAGRGFCSGGDVRAINEAADDRVDSDENSRTQTTAARAQWLRKCAEASRLLHEMPKPTIAMINGACAGAGLSLAGACDLRYAAASAVFRPSFASNGMPGDYGGSWLWPRILGTAKARQLYFFDQRRDAAEALSFGLVDAVYADEQLRAEVMTSARHLASHPGAGLAFAKANLNAATTEGLAEFLDRESQSMMQAREVLVAHRRSAKGGEGPSD